MWTCEFCGCEQSVTSGDRRARASQRADTRSDDLYLLTENDDDYQNVEDAMVVFCVDISGSMSVTTEVRENTCLHVCVYVCKIIQSDNVRFPLGHIK